MLDIPETHAHSVTSINYSEDYRGMWMEASTNAGFMITNYSREIPVVAIYDPMFQDPDP